MSVILTDGTGDGHTAKVTSNNSLKIAGVTLSLMQLATETGDTYNIRSTTIGLTSTGESGILYVKNNENTNLLLESFVVSIKDYVGTDGHPILKIYRNPTGGTVISTDADGQTINRNYGSNKTLLADTLKGAEGKTFTGEDSLLEVILPSTSASTDRVFNLVVVLQKGSSIGLSYTPPAGVTTVDVSMAINVTLNGTQL